MTTAAVAFPVRRHPLTATVFGCCCCSVFHFSLLDRSGKDEKGQGTTPPPLPFWPCLHLWKESSVLEVQLDFKRQVGDQD
ncbi:hypothetical protein Taro_019480 [Colocasia esculenta]|uniref:Uncharacterized protein n=1 Tax=Colocasia esculenta TaxID=4460 RepID=A0A843UL58_COLES|nr:hypothetical protein [Colocasia esculenta]